MNTETKILMLIFLVAANATFVLAWAVEAVIKIRRRRASAIIGYVHQAVTAHLPVGPLCAAASASERGVLARRLAGLAKELEAGHPLGVALWRAAPEVPPRLERLLAASERSGRLAEMLGYVEEREDPLTQVRQTSDRFDSLYLLLIACLVITVLAGFVAYVIPKFRMIFLDFDIQWPPLTEMIFSASSTLSMVPAGTVQVAWLLCIVLLLIVLIRSRGLDVGDWLSEFLWCLPLGRQLVRDRDLSDVCQVMAQGVHAGLPLGTVIEEAQSLRLSRGFRRQLERWGRAVESGEAVEAGAAIADLPPTAVGLLATSQASGSLAQTLRFLSDHYRQRFCRLRALVIGGLVPLVTLGLGAIVAALAVGLISPLMQLIDRFAAIWGGG